MMTDQLAEGTNRQSGWPVSGSRSFQRAWWMVSLISQERETTLQVEGRIPAVWSQRITDGSVLSA